MPITTLEEALVYGLSDIYSAERQIARAMPALAQAAHAVQLERGFLRHLQETHGQLARLDRLAEAADLKLRPGTPAAIDSLLAEAQSIIARTLRGPVRDTLLIALAQRIKHIEIASYGTMGELARQLGYGDAARLLRQSLAEEKNADVALTVIATSAVVQEALQRVA